VACARGGRGTRRSRGKRGLERFWTKDQGSWLREQDQRQDEPATNLRRLESWAEVEAIYSIRERATEARHTSKDRGEPKVSSKSCKLKSSSLATWKIGICSPMRSSQVAYAL
jgi:hypothetical protein